VGSAPAVTSAARSMVDEMKKLEDAAARERESGNGDPRMLEDAVRRLKERLRDLLGAARAAVNDPSPAHRNEFQDQSDNLKFDLKQRELETISTTMLNSGLIQAAAEVSQQLNSAFSDTK